MHYLVTAKYIENPAPGGASSYIVEAKDAHGAVFDVLDRPIMPPIAVTSVAEITKLPEDEADEPEVGTTYPVECHIVGGQVRSYTIPGIERPLPPEEAQPEPIVDLCAAFEADCSDDTQQQIVLHYVTNGLVGALPAWWNEFERRKNLATVLNCPVFNVYGAGVHQAAITEEAARTWYRLATFVQSVRDDIKQYTPEMRAELIQQVQEQVQAAYLDSLTKATSDYPQYGRRECQNSPEGLASPTATYPHFGTGECKNTLEELQEEQDSPPFHDATGAKCVSCGSENVALNFGPGKYLCASCAVNAGLLTRSADGTYSAHHNCGQDSVVTGSDESKGGPKV